MALQRLFAVMAVIGLGFAFPPATAAVECGRVDPETRREARAILELDPESVTTIAYERETQPATLLLRFNATGCDLPASPPDPETEVLPKQGLRQIPEGVVSFIRARADGAEYSVRLSADPQRFEPDSYGGFVEIRAPFLATTRTPVSVSRSEHNVAWPIGIGVAGGLAGLVWFGLLSSAKGATTKIKAWHYPIVFAAAAVVGVVSVGTSYLDQDVWSVEDNGLAAAIAAFTGATTGSMATAIAVLWKEPS